jgi:hypothetical protein
MAVRKVMDCRTMPSESNCSLVIIGEEEEVVRAAVMHAMDVHGHGRTPGAGAVINVNGEQRDVQVIPL